MERFADKALHQIFIEPEGLDTHEIYPNGISTSLPFDVQLRVRAQHRGLEHAHITRPGYAIEYDYFDPRDLQSHARDPAHPRAVFRGPDQRHDRLRGSRGAGTRGRHQRGAARCASASPGGRGASEAYIGVLVDDLDHAGRDRAVPDVHQPRGVPASAARGQRGPAAHANGPRAGRRRRRSGGGARSKRGATWLAAEAARLTASWCGPATSASDSRARCPLATRARMRLLRRPEPRVPPGTPSCRARRVSARLRHSIPRLAEQWVVQPRNQAHYAGYVARQRDEIERSAGTMTALPDDSTTRASRACRTRSARSSARIRPNDIGQAARISGHDAGRNLPAARHLKKLKRRIA